MAIYTNLTNTEVNELIGQYQIGHVTSRTPFAGGLANSSFLLQTSSGRYVLSVCDEKGIEEVSGLVRLLGHLEDNGFNTTQVVPTKDGRRVLSYKQKPVIVKRYIEGSDVGDLTPNMLRNLGREMGKLHHTTVPTGVPTNMPYGRAYFHEITSASANSPYKTWLTEKNLQS